jgi:hypothetical protein
VTTALTEHWLPGSNPGGQTIGEQGRAGGCRRAGSTGDELIHELAPAIRMRAKIPDISNMVHAYPTLAQIHRRAVNTGYPSVLFSRRVKSLVWPINKVLP